MLATMDRNHGQTTKNVERNKQKTKIWTSMEFRERKNYEWKNYLATHYYAEIGQQRVLTLFCLSWIVNVCFSKSKRFSGLIHTWKYVFSPICNNCDCVSKINFVYPLCLSLSVCMVFLTTYRCPFTIVMSFFCVFTSFISLLLKKNHVLVDKLCFVLNVCLIFSISKKIHDKFDLRKSTPKHIHTRVCTRIIFVFRLN